MKTSLLRLVPPLLLLLAGCGDTAADPAPPAAPATTETAPAITMPPTTTEPPTTTTTTFPKSACPVTMPTAADVFSPPPPWPATYPHEDEGLVWVGTPELWTVLPLDGNSSPRKSVWWSVNFPGGAVEEQPPLTVEWRQLDGDEVHTHTDATNAYTVEEGAFMIGGIDLDLAGCWEVTATYKGASMSYVYERG